MEPIVVKFKNKNYYISYDDLINKAYNKVQLYNDQELQDTASNNGKPLIFYKKKIEDKLKGDIKMDSRMPGAAKTEQKLREYIRKQIINILNEQEDAPSEEERIAQEKAAKEAAKKVAYKRFFSQALAKFGVSSVNSIPKEKKREFFDYVDANWTSKQEEPKTEAQNVSDKDIAAQNIGYTRSDGNLLRTDTPPTHTIEGDEYEVLPKEIRYFPYIVNDLKGKIGDNLLFAQNGLIKVKKGTDLLKYVSSAYKDKIEKINTEITETSSTGGVAGYETPGAFSGEKGVSKKQKQIANQLGYKLVKENKLNESHEYYCQTCGQRAEHEEIEDDRNMKCGNCGSSDWGTENPNENESKINEGLDSYYFKDENLTTEQKLGLAMRQVRNNLYEVEKVVSRTIRMKNEENVDSSKVGKRTYQALKRINEKVIRLMIALQDLK